MRHEIEWLDAALAARDVVLAMTHYRVKDRFMTATNGRIIAGHPCDLDGEFLVPGEELKNIFKRLPEDPKVTIDGDKVSLRSGRFSGTLQMLPAIEWTFPELEQQIKWSKFPLELMPVLRDLRPFIAKDATHRWSLGIAIDDGWCYATDNKVLAGAQFPGGKGLQALMPEWVVDFLLQRFTGLDRWAVAENYMAFRWKNGAWMRSTLIDDRFPKQARDMIQNAQPGGQRINPDYRSAVIRVASLTEKEFPVHVYADRVEGRTQRTAIKETIKSVVPPKGECSMWSASSLSLIMGVASSWDPSKWPRSPYYGDRVRGVIAGWSA